MRTTAPTRSDEPAAGMAVADTTIQPDMARTTAVLQLPTNAVVTYARLYWAAINPKAAGSGKTVRFERPGMFSKTLTADAVKGSFTIDSGSYTLYMSTADVTKEVQAAGPGAFRVGAIPTLSPTNMFFDGLFIGWHAVVFYRLDTDPTRNLALFDRL